MLMSVAKDNKRNSIQFIPQEVKFDELHTITRSKHYSHIIFKDGYRKGTNFEQVQVLAIDVDDGYSIKEVQEKLDGYQYLLVTTLHHQLSKKNGKAITPYDKYRLFFPLENPITDPDEYQAIIKGLINEFKADTKCSDRARFFYSNPHQEVYYG